MVSDVLYEAGYEGDSWTSPRPIGGHDHTVVTNPSDGAAEYLTGYFGSDAAVSVMQNGSIEITWVN